MQLIEIQPPGFRNHAPDLEREGRMYMVTDSQSATLSRSADNYANAYIVLRPEYA